MLHFYFLEAFGGKLGGLVIYLLVVDLTEKYEVRVLVSLAGANGIVVAACERFAPSNNVRFVTHNGRVVAWVAGISDEFGLTNCALVS